MRRGEKRRERERDLQFSHDITLSCEYVALHLSHLTLVILLQIIIVVHVHVLG